eukprot:Skav227279  [mRNA]  locus=scaffold3073:37375:46235:+ [translate_table: standard]
MATTRSHQVHMASNPVTTKRTTVSAQTNVGEKLVDCASWLFCVFDWLPLLPCAAALVPQRSAGGTGPAEQPTDKPTESKAACPGYFPKYRRILRIRATLLPVMVYWMEDTVSALKLCLERVA